MTLLSFLYLLLTTLLYPVDSSSIELTVKNIQNESGTIKIALYNSPGNFPNRDKAYRVAEVKATKPQVKYTFEDIPDGDYAMAIFHDENADGELNFKLFFIPKEPYGFSNDFIPRYSKPTFDDARFEVKGDLQMSISLTK